MRGGRSGMNRRNGSRSVSSPRSTSSITAAAVIGLLRHPSHRIGSSSMEAPDGGRQVRASMVRPPRIVSRAKVIP
jgi:hypothetical protein